MTFINLWFGPSFGSMKHIPVLTTLLLTSVLTLFGCSETQPLTPRSTALLVLESLFDDGDLSVLDEYFGETYIQHNPNLPNGTAALRRYAESLDSQTTTHTAHRVAAQDDMVAIQSHVTFGPDDLGMAAFDIFRFENNKIVEHWDVVQPVVAKSETANGHSMFDGAGENAAAPEHSGQEESNIALVAKLYERAFNNADLEALEELVAVNYVQHSPDFSDGRAGLRSTLEGFLEAFPGLHLAPIRFVAEGDLVFVHVHITFEAADRGNQSKGSAGIDVFRVKDGLLVEHWDAVQPVVGETASGNSMF